MMDVLTSYFPKDVAKIVEYYYYPWMNREEAFVAPKDGRYIIERKFRSLTVAGFIYRSKEIKLHKGDRIETLTGIEWRVKPKVTKPLRWWHEQ